LSQIVFTLINQSISMHHLPNSGLTKFLTSGINTHGSLGLQFDLIYNDSSS